jgi:hypothetical protein
MDIQTLKCPATISCFFVILPEAQLMPAQPVVACSRDYGFDFDEDELARELLAPLPAGLADLALPEADAAEFESRYLWFLS